MKIRKLNLLFLFVSIIWLGWAFNSFAAQSTLKALEPSVTQEIKEGVKVSPLLPDLTIDYIKITPANPKLGETITIQFAIKNIGPVTATASFASLYSVGYGYVLNLPSGGVTIQPLAPGQVQVFTFSGILDAQKHVTTGKYNFGVDLNLKKNPEESDYKNNYKIQEFYISPAGGASNQPLPDFFIYALILDPTEPVVGGPATITLIISNNGPGSGGPTNAVFGGKSEILQALGLPVPPSTTPIPVVNPGHVVSFKYSAPGGKLNLNPGSYTLAATVNTSVGAVPEANTSNNSKTFNFNVLTPKPSPVPKGQIELKTK